jgi:hypothetical protein
MKLTKSKLKEIIREEIQKLNEDVVNAFAKDLEKKVINYYKTEYPNIYDNDKTGENSWKVRIKKGKKYTKIDIGSSGKFMYDISDGHLYYIKGYGTIDRKKDFGDLKSILKRGYDYDGFSIASKGKRTGGYGYGGKIV